MNRVLTATIGGAAALVTLGAGTASAVVAAGWVIAAAGRLAWAASAVARWAGLVAVLQGRRRSGRMPCRWPSRAGSALRSRCPTGTCAACRGGSSPGWGPRRGWR